MHLHGGTGPWLIAILAGVLVYLALAAREALRSRPIGGWRVLALLAGAMLMALAFWPGALPWAPGDFRHHMLQHLLIGMLAPIALVLSAPVTLLLKSLPTHAARKLIRLFHLRPVRVLCNPAVALFLNIGGMAALYFTPLYALAAREPVLHHWMHLHFLFAGYLFAWVIAGTDPAPARPSVPVRLFVLGVAIAFHASLSQLLYAGVFVNLPIGEAERQGAAELMYYGGDIAELLLAFALVSTWRPGAARHRSLSMTAT
jgi:putative membrane protein